MCKAGRYPQLFPIRRGKLQCDMATISGRHVALELSATNWKQLWVPPGFAHGYITLESDCEVIYKVTDYWAPESERGIAWNDPGLGIDWRYSASDIIIADKDRS